MITPVILGTTPGDGTGDPARVAFGKLNKPIQGYSFSAHSWADSDWQAAMLDFVLSLAQSVYYDGELSLGNAVSSGSVTGLGLLWTPVRAIAVVRIPVSGLSLTVNVVAGSLTTDGFNFTLSAATVGTSYVLDYLILRERSGTIPLGPGPLFPSGPGGITPIGP